MSRGYRCVILAAVGWLILSAAPAPNKDAQAERPKPPASIQQSLDSIARAQIEAAKNAEPGEYERPCADGERNINSDLCAQWYAASAASGAAYWAKWSFIIAVFGTIGLGVTLWFNYGLLKITQDSGRDAEAALAIAQRNATAAEESLAHAKDIADGDLRPWLSLTFDCHWKSDFHGDSLGMWFKCYVTNHGKYPANSINIESFAQVCNAKNIVIDLMSGHDWHEQRAKMLMERDIPRMGPIAMPGETVEINLGVNVRSDAWIAAASRLPGIGCTIFLTVRAQYYWRDKTGYVEHDAHIQLDTGEPKNWLNADPEIAADEPLVIKPYLGRTA